MSTTARTIDPEHQMPGEVEMVGRDRWEEIRRRAGAGASIRAIARELDLDRKTVRRLLQQKQWKPYQRTARANTLLASHAAYLRRRAAEVGYSAQVSAVARKSVILDGTSTTTCRGCMSEHRRQEPVWTSVRGAGVKAVRPAERGRSEATRLDVGEHTRTLLA